MRLDSSLRWNDEDSTRVIPGEQRETRNPGAYNRGKGVLFLSRRPEHRALSVEVGTAGILPTFVLYNFPLPDGRGLG